MQSALVSEGVCLSSTGEGEACLSSLMLNFLSMLFLIICTVIVGKLHSIESFSRIYKRCMGYVLHPHMTTSFGVSYCVEGLPHNWKVCGGQASSIAKGERRGNCLY